MFVLTGQPMVVTRASPHGGRVATVSVYGRGNKWFEGQHDMNRRD